MIDPYNYADLHLPVRIISSSENSLGINFRLEFPSACKTRYLENSPIMGEYLLPHGKKSFPLAILVHGMGDRSLIPCRLIARDLARQGIASFIVYLIFHTRRATASIRKRYPQLSADEWFESYIVSVTDIRQVIDWAAFRKEINHSQISLLGISFGSFISTIATALDTRINKCILVECGGNSEKITRYSWLLRWKYKQRPEVYIKNQADYKQFLAEVNKRGWDNVEIPKNSYLNDPLTFAGNLKGRSLMMINSLWDEMIPRIASLELWNSLGKPPIYWYPATHASLWLWYPLFRHKIVDFFRNGTP